MMAASVDHQQPRRMARGDRERQIVAVAHRAFATHGYGAVTMETIAREAGVTKPLIYAYFGNKERLYQACMIPAAEALTASLEQAIASADGAQEVLSRGVRAFFAYVDEDRDAWRVLFDETVPAGGVIARRVAEHRDRIRRLFQDAIEQNMTAEQRRNPLASEVGEALAVAVMAGTEALAHWWLSTGKLSAEHAAELLIATLRPGIDRISDQRPVTNEKRKRNDR